MEDRMDQELDALGYLQAVYRGKIIAEAQRMKAAIEALPFERPRLSMSASLDGRGFAKRMERMMEARGLSAVLDARPLNFQKVEVSKETD
jgi:hypothetical protein